MFLNVSLALFLLACFAIPAGLALWGSRQRKPETAAERLARWKASRRQHRALCECASCEILDLLIAAKESAHDTYH